MQVGSRPRYSRQRSGRNRFRWGRMLASLRPRAGSAGGLLGWRWRSCRSASMLARRSEGRTIRGLSARPTAREPVTSGWTIRPRAEQCSGQPRNATPRPEPGCRALEADGL